MKIYKFVCCYFTVYCLLGASVFILVFGFESSLNILKTPPITQDFSGIIILISALIASILVISRMRNRLALQPYPYFMLGFYIGNLSLLLFFFIDALLHKYIIWKFPEMLLIFFAPVMELFLSYLFGFAFLALIPSWLSAYVLFKLVQKRAFDA